MDKLASLLPQTRMVEKLRFRRDHRLPDKLIHSLWSTTARERLHHFYGDARSETYAIFDQEYSYAAAGHARKSRANLFLYSPYAWEAFSQRYNHDLKKILFQFHPHVNEEMKILQKDFTTCSNAISWTSTRVEDIAVTQGEARARSDDSWKLADHIVCASTFTRSTLLSVGADPARVSIIPYGIDLPKEQCNGKRKDGFHVVFVGSGIQRKGLHHLLLAWQRARLPVESSLTLVCRVLEPSFVPVIAATPRTRLMRGVSQAQIEALYGSATLFAMPSLIEGFGQVYLEALSFGLPVLGTHNTCLSDLGTQADGIFVVEAGNVDELTSTLEQLSEQLPVASGTAERARRCARRFTWEWFRSNIQAIL
jgi:glycosyltransferase involved in cell wall biosynthesis